MHRERERDHRELFHALRVSFVSRPLLPPTPRPFRGASLLRIRTEPLPPGLPPRAPTPSDCRTHLRCKVVVAWRAENPVAFFSLTSSLLFYLVSWGNDFCAFFLLRVIYGSQDAASRNMGQAIRGSVFCAKGRGSQGRGDEVNGGRRVPSACTPVLPECSSCTSFYFVT